MKINEWVFSMPVLMPTLALGSLYLVVTLGGY